MNDAEVVHQIQISVNRIERAQADQQVVDGILWYISKMIKGEMDSRLVIDGNTNSGYKYIYINPGGIKLFLTYGRLSSVQRRNNITCTPIGYSFPKYITTPPAVENQESLNAHISQQDVFAAH